MKQVLFDQEAKDKLRVGIDKLARAVKMTLGPRGRAVVIEKGYTGPQVTLDGVTVAKEIILEDKFENLGADLIKQAASKTNDNVGDGTTTSIVLAHAMIYRCEEASKEKGFNVIQLASELQERGVEVIAELEKQKEEINELQKIAEVATISSKDPAIGRLIADIMFKIGKNGVVALEDSNTINSTFEMSEGMKLDRGYVSPQMITDTQKMQAVLDNPRILITDRKMDFINPLIPIFEKVLNSGNKNLLMIVDDIGTEPLNNVILNKFKGIINVVVIKAPAFGDRRREILEDLATITGGVFIASDLPKELKDLELSDLGTAKRIVTDKDSTVIIGGAGTKEAIEAREVEIKNQIERYNNDFDKNKALERLAKLIGGIAIIKVGAPTESAQKELKQRVEDAVSATKAAMQEGIVPGGGMALFNVELNDLSSLDPITQKSYEIICAVLEAPIRAIIENSGEDVERIIGLLRDAEDDWTGFDANTGNIVDLKSAGIIDPLKVTKEALTNAISVAANYLLIGAAVTNLPKEKDENH